jgi:RNase P/RNase MRP subunit p29
MNWPDIFFKPRPARSQGKGPAKTPDGLPAADEAAKADAATLSGADPADESALTGRLPVSQVVLPPAPSHSGSSDTSVVREMAEADTLREMTRSGGIRLIKRDFSFPASLRTRSTVPPFVPKTGATPPPLQEPSPKTEAAAEPPSPARPPTIGANLRSSPAINLSGYRDATAPAVSRPAMTIFRRRTKIADVARIVLPPRREEAAARAPVSTPIVPEVPQPVIEPAPAAVEAPPMAAEIPPAPAAVRAEEPVSTSAVVPPSFPVEIPTGSVLQSEAEMKPAEEAKEVSAPVEAAVETPAEVPVEAESVPAAAREENKAEPAEEETAPPAEQPAPEPAKAQEIPAADSSPPNTPADTREKREFVLSNGERIFGHILSETPEAIYIDHGTLGVLTIARNQIAQRPVEIILINGDRIVGDIIAETADSLFVRHASLGILTVPRNQRSNRVVEAILKDGDRILGEVLGETENFTVIRSATLGTVAVPHNRVAMLNRRAEQVQMRALPPGTAELENKPGS